MDAPTTHDHTAAGQTISDELNIKKLRSLFMQAPAAIALLEGPQHIYTFANPLYQKIFDRTEEQLMGKTPKDVFPELEGQRIYELFDQVYATKEPFTATEFPATFQDNGVMQTRYYNFVIQPIQNDREAVTDLMVHAYEVTRQIEAHKKTQESEAKYSTLFNSIDAGFCTIEVLFDEKGKPYDYRFLEINKAFEQQTGLTNAVGRTMNEYARIEDFWYETYGAVAITGKAVRFENRAENLHRHYDVYAFKVGAPHERKVAVLFTDITQRKKAEEALTTALQTTQQQQRLYDSVTNNTPDLVYVFDPAYRFTYANKALLAMWGKTAEEAIGKGLRENGYEEWHAQMHEREIDEVMAFKKSIRGTVSFPHAELGSRMYDYILAPVFNEHGEVEAIAGTTRDISDLKSAEEALRESEQYFRQLTDTVPAIIWITEPAGNCSYLNQHWYDYTGQTPEEAEGFGWLEATHPDDKEEAGKIFIAANKAQKPFSLLYRLRNREGEYRWCKDSGSPKFSKNGAFEGFVGTVVDVHEERLAEEKIRQSEKQFKDIAEAIPQLVWVCNNKGEVTYFNDKWYQFTGKGPEESLGDRWSNLVHPDDVPGTLKKWNEAQQAGATIAVEYRLKTAGGGYRWVYSNGSPIKDKYGNVERWFGTCTDIDERKNTEQALQESESRFRILADESPMFVFIIESDPLAPVSYWNKTWLDYTGQTFEEAQGRAWDGIIHPDDVSIVMDFYVPAFVNKQPYFIPAVRTKRHDGEYRWHAFKGNPRYLADGSFNGYVGVGFDVHEQKITEERLEFLVAERTKELQRSNEDLQQFAHVASHDLKEPVRKVKTFVSRLEQHLNGNLDETGTRFIGKIHSAANRMFTMIDGVLTYSTINAATQTPQQVNLNEIINDIETDLEVIIQKTGTRFHYHNLPVVEGAPVLLYQLFYNLINNSIKFAKAGIPPQINISSEGPVKEAKGFVRIAVQDNGIGFEHKQAGQIFETFTRLNSKDKYEGTGLGLSLCKKIVERHGGSITAIGTPDEGATFTILLPLLQNEKRI